MRDGEKTLEVSCHSREDELISGVSNSVQGWSGPPMAPGARSVDGEPERLFEPPCEGEFGPLEEAELPREPEWLAVVSRTSFRRVPRWVIMMLMTLTGAIFGYFFGHGHLGFQKDIVVHPVSVEGASGVSDTGYEMPSNDIIVDVKGDVRHPGVVHVPPTARVKDVITAAGGFLDADDSRLINLAAEVDDGQEIVVPNATVAGTINDAAGQSDSGDTKAKASSGIVQSTTVSGAHSTASALQPDVGQTIDLNTADAATLQTIPGIGPAKAEAIIAYRDEHGVFTSVADLEHVKGIGTVTYDKIVPYVVVLARPGK